jgi:hypothetical protein
MKSIEQKRLKNIQVTLNKLYLLTCNLTVLVLFAMLRYVTFKIQQTPLFIAKRHTVDGKRDTMSPVSVEKYYEARSGLSTTTKIYS